MFQFRHSSAFQIANVVDITIDKTPWDKKHCGDISALEVDFTSIDPTDPSRLLPYAFVDPKGRMEVNIHIANETIPRGTELDLKIAFTAFYGSYSRVYSDIHFALSYLAHCLYYRAINFQFVNSTWVNIRNAAEMLVFGLRISKMEY